jgi:4-hydroxy-tetrahydrodipicolinate reductase
MDAPTRRRLLIVGHGKMGGLIEQLAPAAGFEVAGVLDEADNRGGSGITAAVCSGVDVAIEFTHAGAVADNLAALAAHRVNVVIGTTGWNARLEELRGVAEAAGIGVVATANFSLGANVLALLVERAATLLRDRGEYGAFIHEQHHAAKKDAPSGTALLLRDAMLAQGYARTIDMSSTRAGAIPGTHVVGFDGPAETLSLSHVVRDRATFAHGALAAAAWLQGRTGWFSMRDVLGV